MKKLLILFAVVGLVFAMSGCAGDDGDMDVVDLAFGVQLTDVDIASYGTHFYRFTLETDDKATFFL